MLKASAVTVAIGILFSVIAGCGGSQSKSSVTKAEFLRQANSICAERRVERRKAITAAARLQPSEAEMKKIIDEKSIPPYREMTKEISQLARPKGDEEKLATLVSSMEKAADEAESNLASAAIVKANEEATRYGLAECKF